MNPYLMLGGVAGALALAIGGFFAGTHHENSVWQVKWDKHEQEIAAATQAIKDADQNTVSAIVAAKQEVTDAYAKKLAAGNAAYADALRQLRDAADRSRLAPAASAPAECATYAAPPARLSAEDAAVALGIAKDGDDAIRQLSALQAEYQSLVNQLNKEHQP